MKAPVYFLFALFVGTQAAHAADRCMVWPWSPAVIANAEERFNSEQQEILNRLAGESEELQAAALEMQKGSGVLSPADSANFHVALVLEISRIMGDEMAHHAQTELNAAHARYLQVYHRHTMNCW